MNKQLRARSGKNLKCRTHRRAHQELTVNYAYTVTVRDGVPVEIIHQSGCERITGHTLEEFTADPGLWYRIIHEDDRPLVFGMAKLMLADPDNHTLEYRILNKDGSINWVSNTLAPCQIRCDTQLQNSDYSDSPTISYDGIITDITRRKGDEEELKRQMNNKTYFQQRERHAYK